MYDVIQYTTIHYDMWASLPEAGATWRLSKYQAK